MFYCEPCRHKKDWPGLIFASRGKCEVCGTWTACYDIKSPVSCNECKKQESDKAIDKILNEETDSGDYQI